MIARQTLRYVVLATDAWLRGGIMGIEQLLHEIDQIFTSAAEMGVDMSIFRTDAPTFAKFLEVRAERREMVTDFLATVTPELLVEERNNPWGLAQRPRLPPKAARITHISPHPIGGTRSDPARPVPNDEAPSTAGSGQAERSIAMNVSGHLQGRAVRSVADTPFADTPRPPRQDHMDRTIAGAAEQLDAAPFEVGAGQDSWCVGWAVMRQGR